MSQGGVSAYERFVLAIKENNNKQAFEAVHEPGFEGARVSYQDLLNLSNQEEWCGVMLRLLENSDVVRQNNVNALLYPYFLTVMPSVKINIGEKLLSLPWMRDLACHQDSIIGLAVSYNRWDVLRECFKYSKISREAGRDKNYFLHLAVGRNHLFCVDRLLRCSSVRAAFDFENDELVQKIYPVARQLSNLLPLGSDISLFNKKQEIELFIEHYTAHGPSAKSIKALRDPRHTEEKKAQSKTPLRVSISSSASTVSEAGSSAPSTPPSTGSNASEVPNTFTKAFDTQKQAASSEESRAGDPSLSEKRERARRNWLPSKITCLLQ